MSLPSNAFAVVLLVGRGRTEVIHVRVWACDALDACQSLSRMLSPGSHLHLQPQGGTNGWTYVVPHPCAKVL